MNFRKRSQPTPIGLDISGRWIKAAQLRTPTRAATAVPTRTEPCDASWARPCGDAAAAYANAHRLGVRKKKGEPRDASLGPPLWGKLGTER